MTKDDIIRFAREAGLWLNDEGEIMGGDLLSAIPFAILVAAAEREACAKVALAVDDQGSVNQRLMQKRIAAAIRARGND